MFTSIYRQLLGICVLHNDINDDRDDDSSTDNGVTVVDDDDDNSSIYNGLNCL